MMHQRRTADDPQEPSPAAAMMLPLGGGSGATHDDGYTPQQRGNDEEAGDGRHMVAEEHSMMMDFVNPVPSEENNNSSGGGGDGGGGNAVVIGGPPSRRQQQSRDQGAHFDVTRYSYSNNDDDDDGGERPRRPRHPTAVGSVVRFTMPSTSGPVDSHAVDVADTPAGRGDMGGADDARFASDDGLNVPQTPLRKSVPSAAATGTTSGGGRDEVDGHQPASSGGDGDAPPSSHQLRELLRATRRSFARGRWTLMFEDKALERDYVQWIYVEGGGISAKIYVIIVFITSLFATLFMHPDVDSYGPERPPTSVFTSWWLPMVVAVFATPVAVALLFAERLAVYREYILLAVLAIHWPGWGPTALIALNQREQPARLLLMTICMHFCCIVPQPRFALVSVFLVVTTVVIMIAVTSSGGAWYWQTHSYFELMLFLWAVLSVWLLPGLERRSRDAFEEVRRAEDVIALIRFQTTVMREAVAALFPPTPTLLALAANESAVVAPDAPPDGNNRGTRDGSVTSVSMGLLRPPRRAMSGQYAAQLAEFSFRCPETVVVMVDVAGFAEAASRLGYRTVLKHLATLVTALDDLADRHGVEKIHTTGDRYMGAAFAPVAVLKNDRLAVFVARLREKSTRVDSALSLAEKQTYAMRVLAAARFAIAALQCEPPGTDGMRASVHCGTVTAALVGAAPPKCDLFDIPNPVLGDVISGANALLDSAVVHHVHASQRALEILEPIARPVNSTPALRLGGTARSSAHHRTSAAPLLHPPGALLTSVQVTVGSPSDVGIMTVPPSADGSVHLSFGSRPDRSVGDESSVDSFAAVRPPLSPASSGRGGAEDGFVGGSLANDDRGSSAGTGYRRSRRLAGGALMAETVIEAQAPSAIANLLFLFERRVMDLASSNDWRWLRPRASLARFAMRDDRSAWRLQRAAAERHRALTTATIVSAEGGSPSPPLPRDAPPASAASAAVASTSTGTDDSDENDPFALNMWTLRFRVAAVEDRYVTWIRSITLLRETQLLLVAQGAYLLLFEAATIPCSTVTDRLHVVITGLILAAVLYGIASGVLKARHYFVALNAAYFTIAHSASLMLTEGCIAPDAPLAARSTVDEIIGLWLCNQATFPMTLLIDRPMLVRLANVVIVQASTWIAVAIRREVVAGAENDPYSLWPIIIMFALGLCGVFPDFQLRRGFVARQRLRESLAASKEQLNETVSAAATAALPGFVTGTIAQMAAAAANLGDETAGVDDSDGDGGGGRRHSRSEANASLLASPPPVDGGESNRDAAQQQQQQEPQVIGEHQALLASVVSQSARHCRTWHQQQVLQARSQLRWQYDFPVAVAAIDVTTVFPKEVSTAQFRALVDDGHVMGLVEQAARRFERDGVLKVRSVGRRCVFVAGIDPRGGTDPPPQSRVALALVRLVTFATTLIHDLSASAAHARTMARAAAELTGDVDAYGTDDPDDSDGAAGSKSSIEMSVPSLQVTVGVHCGPCYGAVLGKKRAAFDMFGEGVAGAIAVLNEAAPGTVELTALAAGMLDRAKDEWQPRGANASVRSTVADAVPFDLSAMSPPPAAAGSGASPVVPEPTALGGQFSSSPQHHQQQQQRPRYVAHPAGASAGEGFTYARGVSTAVHGF